MPFDTKLQALITEMPKRWWEGGELTQKLKDSRDTHHQRRPQDALPMEKEPRGGGKKP